MTDFILMLLLLFGFIFVLVRLGIFAPATFLCFMNFVSSMVLFFVVTFSLSKYDFMDSGTFFSAMPMHGLEDSLTTTLIFFLFITSMCVLSCADIKVFSFKAVTGTAAKAQEVTRLKLLFKHKSARRNLFFIALFFIVSSVIHFIDLDKSVLWFNYQYLTIKDPALVGISNEFTNIYHHFFRLVGLFSGVIFVVLLCVHRYFLAFLFLMLWFYGFTLLLIGSSRWVVLYLGALYLAARIFGSGFLWAAFRFLIPCLALLLYTFMIYARSSGEFGLGKILSDGFSIDFFSQTPLVLRGILINIFEGALNVSNSVRLAPEFSARYEWLSISPLISAIDGFSDVRDLDKAKFAVHVPMGAFGEVYHFGLSVQIIYFVLLFFTIRTTVLLQFRFSFSLFIIISIFYCYVFYLLPTYSTRTTFRFLLLGLVCIFWPIFRSRKYQTHRLGSNQERGI